MPHSSSSAKWLKTAREAGSEGEVQTEAVYIRQLFSTIWVAAGPETIVRLGALTRPYGESFIRPSASSSDCTFIIPTTGPKVSSIMISISTEGESARLMDEMW